MSAGWEPWGPEAFDRARREKKPVLVLFSAHSGVADAPDLDLSRFVAVLADHRDRPDLARRYDIAGGLAVLDPGFAQTGSVDVHDGRLKEALARAAAEFHARAPEKEKNPAAAPAWTGAVGFTAPAALDAARPAGRVAAIKAAKGTLDLWSLELLMHAAGEWGDAAAGRLASAQLERWRAAAVDQDLWSVSYFLRLFSDGAALLESAALADRAKQLGSALLGAYRNGKPLDRRYFGGERRAYADANAFAALSLLRLGRLSDAAALTAALDLLETLEREFYDPVLGMVHHKSGGAGAVLYGLLDDNAWAALAFTEAYLATGRKAYREFADALAKFLFQELWDRERGGFVDRIARKDDLEPLRRPVRPAYENAVAFETLWRLHHLKGNANYGKWLDWGLRSLLAQASEADDAPLLRVQDMLARGRCDLELVGKPDDPKTRALLDAVNGLFVPRRIVSFVDPDDQDYVLAHKLEASSYPRLFACDRALKRVADTDDPKSVAAVIEALRK